ncbi:MAG: pyridoxal phosphate-dependent aminotransferase family protein [Bacteroidota bacterium]|nr:pyridoxal phosphate-dependent aminotransferase family protein [Bacteroidota bacterium]
MPFPDSLLQALNKRKEESLFRVLYKNKGLIDFCSNDYLGFSRSATLGTIADTHDAVYGTNNGSTGSRLISGNSEAIELLEHKIAHFHNADAGIIYNSGYDANIGLLSCIGKKDDVFIYDDLIHASLHDGMRLSHAAYYKFRHNDIHDLERLLIANKAGGNVYVVIESVYSMDGDSAPLQEIARLKKLYPFQLIVDEAHATGVFGNKGKGLCNAIHLEKESFARIYTFGKALGVHGAIVVGNQLLKDYLVNFSRSFIYTTALSPHSYSSIDAAYDLLDKTTEIEKLQHNISIFKSLTKFFPAILPSESSIHCVIVPGNNEVTEASRVLREKGFDVRPIKSPTVRTGSERLRICLHSFNTETEINTLCEVMKELRILK